MTALATQPRAFLHYRKIVAEELPRDVDWDFPASHPKIQGNFRLRSLQQQLGRTAAGQYRGSEIRASHVSAFITGRENPFDWRGHLRDYPRRIAKFHGVSPTWLWSAPDPVSSGDVDPDDLPSDERADKESDRADLAAQIRRVLSTLRPREERVIRGHFFENKTLWEIGKEMRIGREGARKIEFRALRKLRHPSRYKSLVPFSTEEKPRRNYLDEGYAFARAPPRPRVDALLPPPEEPSKIFPDAPPYVPMPHGLSVYPPLSDSQVASLQDQMIHYASCWVRGCGSSLVVNMVGLSFAMTYARLCGWECNTRYTICSRHRPYLHQILPLLWELE